MKPKTSKSRALAFIEEASGFGTAGDVLVVAMLREVADALEKAITAYPDLAPGGFDRKHAPFKPDMQTLVGISTSLAFKKQFSPSKTINIGSYSLKHMAEDWSDANDLSAYICNGALIVAAVALDFPVQRRRDGLNAGIAVSRKSLKKVMKSFPNGWWV
jgi:hypothetical protein